MPLLKAQDKEKSNFGTLRFGTVPYEGLLERVLSFELIGLERKREKGYG